MATFGVTIPQFHYENPKNNMTNAVHFTTHSIYLQNVYVLGASLCILGNAMLGEYPSSLLQCHSTNVNHFSLLPITIFVDMKLV